MSSVRVAPAPPTAMRTPHPTVEHDIFGLTTTSSKGTIEVAPTNIAVATQDMIGLFGNIAMSDKGLAVSSPAIPHQVRDPFSPTPNAHSLTPPQQLTLPRQAVPSNSHAGQQQQVPIISPQVQHHAPQAYMNSQPQNTQFSVPPQQYRPAMPQQQSVVYGNAQPQNTHVSMPQQPQHASTPTPQVQQPVPHAYMNSQHNNTPQVSAPPQQHYQQQPYTGYMMPQQQQQHYQVGGQQQPPPQPQYMAQQPPPAQPTKPNLSQFDPFQ
jgi:hypothetical protein